MASTPAYLSRGETQDLRPIASVLAVPMVTMGSAGQGPAVEMAQEVQA